MFKTTFSKYLTAFVIIILVSFLALSGIITSTIRTSLDKDKENNVAKVAEVLVQQIEKTGAEDLGNYSR